MVFPSPSGVDACREMFIACAVTQLFSDTRCLKKLFVSKHKYTRSVDEEPIADQHLPFDEPGRPCPTICMKTCETRGLGLSHTLAGSVPAYNVGRGYLRNSDPFGFERTCVHVSPTRLITPCLISALVNGEFLLAEAAVRSVWLAQIVDKARPVDSPCHGLWPINRRAFRARRCHGACGLGGTGD